MPNNNVVNIRAGERTRLLMMDAISAHISRYGWAPTLREIAQEVGISSPSTILKHLHTLEREGKLVLGGGPRMIRLVDGRRL